MKPITVLLSTTVMPARGSRLEAWRIAPGGMPEQLHTSNPKEPGVGSNGNDFAFVSATGSMGR